MVFADITDNVAVNPTAASDTGLIVLEGSPAIFGVTTGATPAGDAAYQGGALTTAGTNWMQHGRMACMKATMTSTGSITTLTKLRLMCQGELCTRARPVIGAVDSKFKRSRLANEQDLTRLCAE